MNSDRFEYAFTSRSQQDALVRLALVAALFTVTLPLTFRTGIDATTTEWAQTNISPTLRRLFLIPSEPALVTSVMILAAAYFAWRRQWRSVAMMILAPQLATGLNAWILKPLFNRHEHEYLAYPSGHTAYLVSVLTALALLAPPGRPRTLVVIVGAVATLSAGLGMVAFGYHLPADVLGGAAAAVAMVRLSEVAVFSSGLRRWLCRR